VGERQTGKAALLIVDMINDLEFDGGDRLREPALAAARAIRDLKAQARRSGLPIIYVNDNRKAWHDDRATVIGHATRPGTRGEELSRALAPDDDDYFVIKPRLSGFYATNLPVLLPELGVSRLIVTGIAVDLCVLCTAADAHMRNYDLWVPEDAVAGEDEGRKRWALEVMSEGMSVQTASASELALSEWLAATAPNPA
jgi:nicotinamidase-related amidase